MQTHFGIFLDFESLLSDFPEYFINSGNLYGPGTGKPSKSGKCTCRNTFYSDALLKKITPSSNDCYISTKDEMVDILLKNFPKTKNIYDLCEGGPEVGIIPPDGEILLKKYIRHVVFPPKEKLSNYTRKILEKNGGVDDFFTVVSSPLKGGKKTRKRVKKQKNN